MHGIVGDIVVQMQMMQCNGGAEDWVVMGKATRPRGELQLGRKIAGAWS